MIIYTLLSSYPKQELINVLLTSSVIYYILYCMLPISDQYNYIILSVIAVVDLYFTKYRHGRTQRKHVTFNKASPSVYNYKPWMTPQYRPTSPPQYYMHAQSPTQYYNTTSAPQYYNTTSPPQYYMNTTSPPQYYMNTTSPPQYHQPPAQQTTQYQPQAETFPTIDNRHLVPVDAPSAPQYEESEISDDMTYISEDTI